MSEQLRRIIPTPPPPADEVFAVEQVSGEFYREVQYRQEFERYCQWYYMTAERHRQELEQMRGELCIFSWFLRGRR